MKARCEQSLVALGYVTAISEAKKQNKVATLSRAGMS